MQVKKGGLIAGLAVLFAAQAGLNYSNFPLWKENYSPIRAKSGNRDISGLDGVQQLFAMVGFREMLAGILWVRADTYFEQGNYDAILPIIRLVTMLDPQQIDVYATGMWHIGYNFTDEESRSDRRYLSTALALGREGAENNPNTYELFFETGWIWYHKVDDNYENAVFWWEEAHKREDMQGARKNILANAYMRNGQLDKAIELYEGLLDDAEKDFEEDSKTFHNRQLRDTIENNLDNLLVRMAQRGNFALDGGWYGEGKYDTKPPFDVGFSVKVTIPESRILQVEGSWNVQPIGSRIRVVLRDKNFPNAIPAGADWGAVQEVRLDPVTGQTFMQDSLFVRNQSFNTTLRMDRDPTMYPFAEKEYVIEFYYNPRSAPPHIQDKFGFNGEGLTDKNYLSMDARKGQRVLYCSFELTQDMLLRRGKWATETPIVLTPGFRDVNAPFDPEIISAMGIEEGATRSEDLIPVATDIDDTTGR